jgi:quinol monooxygenase YgiN
MFDLLGYFTNIAPSLWRGGVFYGESEMLLIVGTVRLPPENLERAKPVMRAMVEASRAEAGCLEYVYAEDLFVPGLIHVKERWTNQAALDAHFASAHIQAWRESWEGLGIGGRDLKVYEVGEPRKT